MEATYNADYNSMKPDVIHNFRKIFMCQILLPLTILDYFEAYILYRAGGFLSQNG